MSSPVDRDGPHAVGKMVSCLVEETRNASVICCLQSSFIILMEQILDGAAQIENAGPPRCDSSALLGPGAASYRRAPGYRAGTGRRAGLARRLLAPGGIANSRSFPGQRRAGAENHCALQGSVRSLAVRPGRRGWSLWIRRSRKCWRSVSRRKIRRKPKRFSVMACLYWPAPPG